MPPRLALSLALPTAALLAAIMGVPPSVAEPSPYAGQEARALKALSAEEIDELLDGRGMGLARVAEINGHPGPAHALDMAAELGIDGRQADALSAVKARMTVEARRLGAEIVARERALDRAFAEGRADPADIIRAAAEIGELQGRLRAVHLVAHVEARELLTPDQVRRYAELRGYGRGPHGHGPGSHQDHHGPS